MRNILILIICLLTITTSAQQNFTPEDFDQLQDSIESIMQKKKIPGIQIAIVNKDSVIWNGNLGYADIKDSIPVGDHTLFRIGSTTKSFVAISAFQLIEQGKLSLEDEVKVVAPEVPFKNKWEETNPIRLKHLLEHTTGFDDVRVKEYAVNGENWTTLEGLEYHPPARTSRWEPGMHMSYCNAGPAIAAFMVEKKSMLGIEDYVQKNIFDPLQMKNSSFFLTEYVEKNLSKGYLNKDYDEADYWHFLDRASGSINSTALEMANYVRLFLNRGTIDSIQILTPESINRIEKAHTTLSAKAGVDEGYGCYIYSNQHKGVKMYGHNGAMGGFLNSMHYFPELGLGFAFTINNSGVGGFNEIQRLVYDFLIPDQLEKSASDFKTDATIAPEMLGWYRSATTRSQIGRMADWLTGGCHLYEVDGRYYYKPIIGSVKEAFPVKNNVLLMESKNHSFTSIVFTEDNQGNQIIQLPNFTRNFIKSSAFSIWGTIGIAFICLALFIISLLGALVWVPVQIFGKQKISHIRAYAWPFVSVLLLIGLISIFGISSNANPIEKLGHLTWWSFGIFAFSILFAINSIIALFVSIFSFRRTMNPAARILQLLIALACFTTTAFLYHWEFIGLMTWAY